MTTLQVLLNHAPAPATVDVVDASATGPGGRDQRARQAGFQLTPFGAEQTKAGDATYVTVATWLLSGSASAYDVRMTSLSSSGTGTLTGTVGSWLNLGTMRTWVARATAAVPGNYQNTLLCEVRDTATGTVLDSCTVTLSSYY